MKIVTKSEEQDHYQAVIKGGTKFGLGGLATGTVGALIANRYWSGFRNLTLPLKAFALTSIGTFSLIIGADRASREYGDNHLDDDRWADENLEHQLGLDSHQELKRNEELNRFNSLSPRDQFIESLKKKKYEIVLGSWAASMIGSFGLVAAQPLPFTQKLVQARMYAQSLTVAMIIASAGLASMASSESKNSTSEDLRANSMYRFKKGSPHELREREGRDNKAREVC